MRHANEWKVKTTWATKINQMEWGKMVRVRIRTRDLLGREPTEDELGQNVDNDGPFGSPDTVISAYNKGEEVRLFTVTSVQALIVTRHSLCGH